MTTWNPSDKDAAVTLSNGNLTASSSLTNIKGVRATTSKSASIVAFEIKVNAGQPAFGIANSGVDVTNPNGAGGNYYTIYQNTTQIRVFRKSSFNDISVITGTIAVNDVWTIILDLTNLLWYSLQNGVNFHGNFAARTGGLGLAAGSYFPYAHTQNHNPDTWTIATSSLVNRPSGAAAWDDAAPQFRSYNEFGMSYIFNSQTIGGTRVFPGFVDSTQGTSIVAPIFIFPRSRHYVRR